MFGITAIGYRENMYYNEIVSHAQTQIKKRPKVNVHH